jgi:small-conductance mechanosensitive channel
VTTQPRLDTWASGTDERQRQPYSQLLYLIFTSNTTASLFRAAISAAGWIIVIGAALNALGLDEVALAVSGSIALVALALGTAVSGTTSDIIAGVFLASDEDFKVGYTVTAAGVTGVIKSIDLRKSRILAEDGKLHVVPNTAVETATRQWRWG